MDFENRPMMLKDFLGYCNSCNNESTVVISSKRSQPPIMLLRTRSKRAATTTISAIQKVMSAVRFFHFESVKSPPLDQGRRRRLTDVSKKEEVKAKVKVKDILRWRSFRDLEEAQERSTPLDFPSYPTANISPSTWSESDSDDEDQNQESDGKKFQNWSIDDDQSDSEQQSPVSVLCSPFQQQVPTISKCKLKKRFHQDIPVEKIEPLATFEERARQLLGESGPCDWNLVMDYYMDEVMSGNAEDSEVLNCVKSWMNGECSEMYEWELEDNRKAYVEDMERGISWKKFEEGVEEVARDVEMELLDELLLEFLAQ